VPAQAPKPPSRSEAKNAAVRACLEPIEPGERPLVLTIGAAVAVAVVVANLVVYLAGWTYGGHKTAFVGFLLFAAIMLIMAWGLWNAKYWAVLGLEALLGVLVVALGLFLMTAENVKSALILLAIIVPAGALFWFNVRVMARIQMPERPQPRR
jgi:peptidoglycan/LPS O-acetylase OafA/YrhL